MAVQFVNNAALLSGAFDRLAGINAGKVQASKDFQSALDQGVGAINKKYQSGQIAKALGAEGTDYQAAAQRAMELGDVDTAMRYAELYDKSLDRQAQTAYQNMQLDLDAAKAGREIAKQQDAERKQFIKDNPQIASTNAVKSLLAENEQLYSTFDKDFKSRADYASQGSVAAGISNLFRGSVGATSEERAARKKFDTLRKQSVIELRQQMKGQGVITDAETDLLRAMEDAKNPYEFELAGQQLVDMWNRRTESNAAMAGYSYPTGPAPTTSKYSGLK